jgi:ribonuclease P protein component
MLPKENRLKKKKDFEAVFKKGRGIREGFFYLKTLSNDMEFSRFGFVVSKKISTSAVVRNRIKRKIREFFRLNLGKIKTGLDCVLVVLSPIKKEDYNKIEGNLNKIVSKSNIYA